MASVTIAQAALQSQDPLIQGLVQELYTTDPWFSQVPVIPVTGRNYSFIREASEHGGTWCDIDGTVNVTQATVTAVNHPLGRAVGDVVIDRFESTAMDNPNDLIALHGSQLARRLIRRIRNAAINGTGTFPNPLGLLSHVASANVLNHSSFSSYTTASGVTLTLAVLDRLLDEINAPGQPFFMGDKACVRTIKAALISAGTNVNTVELGFTNPISGQQEFTRVLEYAGVPIFTNENISTYTTQSNTGQHRMLAGVLGGEGISVLIPRNVSDLVTFEDPFLAPTTDNTIWRARAIMGITCRSTEALAELGNITI